MDKKIKIGYQDIVIERETTTFQKQSDAYGEYDHRKNSISIQNGLSPLDEANTLLHEILHGVAYINSLTQTGQPLDSENKEEIVINQMTNGLSQVFRDNKWLLPYFRDKFK
jgi:Zn-dependent peptidase ImmA (M78 family)